MLGCDLFYGLDLVHEYQQEMDELAEQLRRRSHSSEIPTHTGLFEVGKSSNTTERDVTPTPQKQAQQRTINNVASFTWEKKDTHQLHPAIQPEYRSMFHHRSRGVKANVLSQGPNINSNVEDLTSNSSKRDYVSPYATKPTHNKGDPTVNSEDSTSNASEGGAESWNICRAPTKETENVPS
jgi:hypothetical protein